MAAEHVGFAQRLVVDHQRQVERELHAGAGADRADVLDAAAHLVEQRLGAREILLGAAGDAQQLALPRRADGAADRALDEGGALGPHLLGQRHLGLGLHRAHLDDELALDVAGEQPRRALVDGAMRVALVRMVTMASTGLGKLGRRLGDLGAGVGERLELVRRAVPDGDLVPDLDQARGNRRPHATDTSNADAHRLSPSLDFQRPGSLSSRAWPASAPHHAEA